MTTVIDERVVEMRFNNADFEKNVAQSMDTLDKLKKSLNIDSAKSLENIGKASKNFSLSGMTETITQATTKFSALEIAGVTAIANITNKAMDFGIKFVKSLSIDQVSSGFTKYAQKTTAVQTIIAATHKSILEVESEMQKLNWFTDETSYNFVDMVNNIGKFTSNGVKLEAASGAMQGIATWAARSGQNAQAASRAMYNFSQALGSGAMMVKDWMSIEQANMATTEFKQTAIETAVELGKLKKTADGLYTTLDGKTTVSVNEFRDSLKKKWFDTDVIIATLNRYNQYAEELYALSEKTGRTASQLMIDADKYKEGTLDIESVAKSSKMSVTELAKAYESLNSETNKLSREAFKNAQEAKTFQEVMDATADAVSTSWMNTFQLIFGNYEEAKALWSGMANMLVDAFTQGGTARNEVLGFWREGDIDGRVKLLEAAVNVLNAFTVPLKAIKEAFVSMLPGTEQIGKRLQTLTANFADFTKKLIPSEKAVAGIYNTFRGLFSIGKAVLKVINSLIKAIIPAAKPFGSLLEMIVTFTGYIGVFISAIVDYADEVGVFKTITETLVTIFGKVITVIKNLGSVIVGGILLAIQKFVSMITKLVSKVTEFISKSQAIQSFLAKISDKISKLKRLISGTERPIEKVNTVIKKAEQYFGLASESGAEFGTVTKDIGNESKKALTPLEKLRNTVKNVGVVIAAVGLTLGKGILTIAKNIKNFFADLFERFKNANANSKSFVDVFKSIFAVISGLLTEAGENIKKFFDSLGINTDGIKSAFDTIGGAIKGLISSITPGKIAAIALSVALLALVGSAIEVSSKFKDMASAISGVFTNINKILKKQFSKTSLMTDIAKSFAIIAGSLALLTFVDQDALKSVSLIMAGFIGTFTLLTAVVAVLANKLMKADFHKNFKALSKSIILLAGSMAILSASLLILSQIKMDNPLEMVQKVEMAVALLASVAGIATVMSYISKDLPKGAVLLLALALSMRQLVKSLLEFSELPYDKINDHWRAFIAMFGGLALVIAAAGQIKLGSATGLLVLALALKTMLPAISQIVDSINELPLTDMLNAALKHWQTASMFAIGAMTIMITVVKVIDKFKDAKKSKAPSILTGISGTLLGIGAGLYLMVAALENISTLVNTMNGNQWAASLVTVVALLGTILLFFAGLSMINNMDTSGTLEKDMTKMAIVMLGAGAALVLMAKAVDIIANTKLEGVAIALVAIGALGGVITAILFVAKDVTKAMPAVTAMIGMCAAIGVLMGELAILSLLVQAPHIGEAVILLGGIFAALWVMLKQMEAVKDVNTGPMVALAVSVGLIGASLAVLSFMDMSGILVATFAMAAVMGALAVVINQMGKITVGSMKLNTVLAAVTTLGLIGAALTILATQDWHSILAAGLMMTVAMAAIAGVLIVLDKIGSQGGQLSAAGSILAISLAMIAIAEALKVMQGVDWKTFGMFAAAIGTIAGVLGVLAVLSLGIQGFGAALSGVAIVFVIAASAFGIISLSFAVFAATLPALASGIDTLVPSLQNLAQVPLLKIALELAAFGAVGAILALITPLLMMASVGITTFSAAVMASGVMLEVGAAGFEALVKGIKLLAETLGNAATAIKNKIGDIVKAVSSLFKDTKSTFHSADANSVINAASDFGKKVGGRKNPDEGFVGGLASSSLGWHSPPKIIEELLGDIGSAFSNNSSAVSAANASGQQVGNGFGQSIMSSISGWAQNIPGMISGIFSGMSFNFSGFSTAVKEDVVPSMDLAKSGLKSYNIMQNKTNKALGDYSDQAKIYNKSVKSNTQSTSVWGNIQKGLNDGLTTTKGIMSDIFDVSDLLPENLKDAADAAKDGTDANNGLSESLEGVGGAAGKASEGVKDFASSIKDTISGQLDIFSKFETKQEVSAETMLENMRSNINGFASWSHRLAVLAERGIDQALYQKLAEMGPKGYETVAAFVQMTDEQLKEANELFATSLTLPQSQADIVTAGFTYAGEMASQGFSNALQEHDAAHAAAHGLGQAAIDGINEALEVHSPSRKTYETGVFAVKGLQMGIGDASAQALVLLYVRMLCRSVIGEVQANMKSDQFYQIGKNATLGLAQGIADSDAAAQVMARAGEIAAAAGAKMAAALQEHSPSRLTRKIGKYASLGLAIGISDGAKNVIDASEAVAEEGMSGFGRLQEVLSEGIDFNPVITPMLDLSVIRSQISELNAMIDSNAISAEAQNGGQFTGNPTQQINFTQNNYSPKELSRYEIYRNTKNQINMMKGVVKANA